MERRKWAAEMTAGSSSVTRAFAHTTARSTNDLVRRQNLATVLTMLHLDGTLSRGEIGEATGLTRSTIAGLASELVELGLAVETESAPTGRVGRPSLALRCDDRIAALSVRVEPDAVTVSLVGLGGAVHSRLRHNFAATPSPRRFVRVAASLVEAMKADIDRHYRVVGAGLAVPGLVDPEGSVLVAPAMGWRGERIARRLEEAIGYSVRAGNDASIGAFAEARFGPARDAANLLYLGGAFGGIGGGVIVDGEPLRGMSGFAGELGHTVIDRRGRPCVCGRRGCLEAEVAPTHLLALLGRQKLDEDEFDVEIGVARDPAVLAELERQVELLSIALTNFVNAFSPEVVVLSGYLGVLLSASRERLAEAVRVDPLGADGRVIRLQRTRLRSRLMQIGPAELPFAPLLADPASIRQ